MVEANAAPLSLKDFLEASPPGAELELQGLLDGDSRLQTPELQLECPNPACNGTRFFSYAEDYPPRVFLTLSEVFLPYVCKNCGKYLKRFALLCEKTIDGGLKIVKVGEWPPFGPRLPSKLITLLREDQDRFLKGRRAENQGLGIGAFAYYRRVVESEKDSLLDQIIKVAKKLGGTPELIAELQKAKKEHQFSKAVEQVKHAIPQSLLIGGKNPLLLLHNALSQGLHNESDEECLKIARDIRLVLTELAERVAVALLENKELEEAVKRLASTK